jgi:HSP20 family protein
MGVAMGKGTRGAVKASAKNTVSPDTPLGGASTMFLNIHPFQMFREMEALRREIDRIASGVVRGGTAAPAINVREDEKSVTVEALLPGLKPDSLSISALRNELTIAGERAPLDAPRNSVHRNERPTGRFSRTLTFATELDPDKATATYRNGVLTVTVAKAAAAQARQIAISSN